MSARSTWVDHIPVSWVGNGERLALWLPYLGGTKEEMLPALERLADAGFTAVSLDPWQHGERAAESPDELYARVFGAFRRHMWPIAGQTALDCLRVIDWAVGELGTNGDVVAGGVSMGGDVAVVLGGIEPRVERVAALVATPDWTRPGMQALDGGGPLDQGQADAYAQWFYDRLDPMTHPERYGDRPEILFECGGEDHHVPAEAALRFGRGKVNVRPGLGHIDGAQSPEMHQSCLDWLSRR
jgi:uncharacterized protein